jgi:CHAT domain-containing protein
LLHLRHQRMAIVLLFFFASLSNLSIAYSAYPSIGEGKGKQSEPQVTENLIGERNRRAQDLRKNGKYSKALELTRETVSLIKQNNLKNKEPETLYILGTIQRLMGDYSQALVSFHSSLDVAQSLSNQAYITLNQNSIGNVYLLQGNYAKALGLYEKVKDEAEKAYSKSTVNKSNEEGPLATVWSNIGEVHKKLGNDSLALDCYNQSLRFQGSQVTQAKVLNDMGEIYQAGTDYPKAEELFRKSLELAEKDNLEAPRVSALNSLGNLYLEQKKYALALEYHKLCLQVAEKLGHREKLVISLYSLANTFFRIGDYDNALTYAGQSATLGSEITLLEYVWRAHTLEGKIRRLLKQPEKAAQNFIEAIATIEQLRNQAVIDQQIKQKFFEDKITPYYEMVDLMVEQNQIPDAWLYAEQAKGRVLFETFQSGKVDLSKSLTIEEREKERFLEAEIVFLNTQITKQRKDTDRAIVEGLQAELKKARNDYESLRAALYAKHPELQIQRGESRPINFSKVASTLVSPQTALLEFVVLEDKTYLFAVTKNQSNSAVPLIQNVYKIAITRDELGEKVKRFRQQIENKSFNVAKLSGEIYELLLKPAEQQIKSKSSLLIVPEGTLWDLPFQALQPSSTRYLIEDFAISYAQSASLLQEIINLKSKHRRTGATTLLAVGNPALGEKADNPSDNSLTPASLAPLPQAERQVKQLAALYGNKQSKIYTGAEALEETIKQDAGKYDIVHFAAHSILNSTSPMYSNIVLSQVANRLIEDGLLEAWEVAKMDLNANLVVLSACETARGRVSAGEGVIGLSWAFFVAGSPTTVVSQWKVLSASTTDFMVDFYRNLQTRQAIGKGQLRSKPETALQPNKAEALRQAALKMLKSGTYREPLYWAPFIVIGDPD